MEADKATQSKLRQDIEVLSVSIIHSCLLDRPFCERDLMFCACFYFFSQLTFSDVRQPNILKTFLSHDVALAPKETLLC